MAAGEEQNFINEKIWNEIVSDAHLKFLYDRGEIREVWFDW